jgi:small subunit ribosomal protein S6
VGQVSNLPGFGQVKNLPHWKRRIHLNPVRDWGSGKKRKGEMRIYEIMFIVRPDVVEEDLDKLIAQFEGIVTSTGGKVQKAEKWGRRRLAYEVKRCREGQYILFTIECDPPTVREFERRLKVADAVVKFLTVRVDPELKRLAKIKKKRELRAARRRKPAPAGTAPAAVPAVAQVPAPAAPVVPSLPAEAAGKE